jgi:uncharacterized membrane protein
MLYALLKTLHVLSIVAWVGGMFFVMLALRPAAAALDPPLRLKLMRDALGRFFTVVNVAAALTLVTGIWMIGRVARTTVQAGGSFSMPLEWLVMTVLGIAMVLIYVVLRFVFFRRLSAAVDGQQWPVAGEALGRVRLLVHANAGLALVIIVTSVWGGAT